MSIQSTSDLIERLEDQGFTVVKTRRGGHYKCVPPSGQGVNFIPSTPSDIRSLSNTVSDLVKIGFDKNAPPRKVAMSQLRKSGQEATRKIKEMMVAHPGVWFTSTKLADISGTDSSYITKRMAKLQNQHPEVQRRRETERKSRGWQYEFCWDPDKAEHEMLTPVVPHPPVTVGSGANDDDDADMLVANGMVGEIEKVFSPSSAIALNGHEVPELVADDVPEPEDVSVAPTVEVPEPAVEIPEPVHIKPVAVAPGSAVASLFEAIAEYPGGGVALQDEKGGLWVAVRLVPTCRLV